MAHGISPSHRKMRGKFVVHRQSLMARLGARVSFRTAPGIPTGHAGRFLVRERDDDQEGDHNKGDRISIKPFPIEVDTHRTALLFAEATKQISLRCRRSNGVPAMHKAQQHFGMRRTRAIQFTSLEATEGRKCDATRSLIVGIPVPGVLGRPRYESNGLRPISTDPGLSQIQP
jgi:hypothetical protein